MDQRDAEIVAAQPIGGDLTEVARQMQQMRTLNEMVEVKAEQVNDVVKLTHAFLLQQDIRPGQPVESQGIFAEL